jgi:hypothetical protein
MRVTCERCLRRYDVPDATVKGRKIRARCKCGARVVVQDEERAARSSAGGSQTTGSIQRPVRWFVDITSWEPIAMDLRQLVRAFDGGRIDADTLVWRKGMPDWRRLRDVPELAERLMGAEAAAKASAAEVPLDTGATDADPPPALRGERSRTPPANYSVDERASLETAGAGHFSASPAERLALSTPAPATEGAATLPGVSVVPQTPAGGYTSPTPPRTRARPERHALPSEVPSEAPVHGSPSLLGAGSPLVAAQTGSTQVGLSVAGSAPLAAEPRTITQTGLAPAASAIAASATAAWSSTAPSGTLVSATSADARAAEPEVVRVNVTAVAPAPRNTRSPTPAAGARRVPNNDETPAQKPSSISVPSGRLVQSPPRPRGRHLVALAVLLLGVGLLVRGTLSTESLATAPASPSEYRPTPPAVIAEPTHIEDRNALEPKPERLEPPAPVPPPPRVVAAPLVAPATGSNAAGSVGAGALPRASAPQRVAQTVPAALIAPAVVHPPKPVAAPSPTPSTSAPIAEVRPSQPERPLTGASEPAPVMGRGELAAPAAPSEPPPVAPVVQPPAQPPAAGTRAAPAAPSAFDEKRAREQMGIAAFQASTCSQLGDTRGVGQVNVVIEHWGRVVRVTHLNQAFVGTPVGLCIMQAFQQVQVAPFDGGPRTLTGSFAVQ